MFDIHIVKQGEMDFSLKFSLVERVALAYSTIFNSLNQTYNRVSSNDFCQEGIKLNLKLKPKCISKRNRADQGFFIVC